MDLDQKKLLLTQIVGRFYQNIYFSSYSPLQVQNLPRQSLPENSWVRVRNRLSGISGSDLHLLYHGGSDRRIAAAATPSQTHIYPGHEVVGEVIEIGDDVQRLNVGDRVVLQWKPNCVTADIQPVCRSCAAGDYNLCERGAFLAPAALGGGWSEEMLLPEQQLFRVPIGLTNEQAVMMEPAAMALHAVLRHLPRPGEKVLIIGAGTVGLLTQQIIRALVPQAQISVLARYPFQVEQATRMGAAHIIYPQDAYVGVQRATNAKLYTGLLGNQTLQGGYDVIYDTVGRKRSALHQNTLHHALRWVHARGTVVLVGLSLHPLEIDLTPLWNHEITLLGSSAPGVERWPANSNEYVSTFKIVADLMSQGRISPEQLITHHFALNNYKHALQTATNKTESRAIKVVFDYSLLPASVVPNVRASAPRIRRQSTINFMDEQDEQDNERPRSRSGALSQMPKTPALTPKQDTGIPSAQQHTKELAKKLKTQAPLELFDDDDTATALPVIGRPITGNFRSYTTQSREEAEQKRKPTTYEPEDRTQLFAMPSRIPQTEANLDQHADTPVQVTQPPIADPQEEADTALEGPDGQSAELSAEAMYSPSTEVLQGIGMVPALPTEQVSPPAEEVSIETAGRAETPEPSATAETPELAPVEEQQSETPEIDKTLAEPIEIEDTDTSAEQVDEQSDSSSSSGSSDLAELPESSELVEESTATMRPNAALEKREEPLTTHVQLRSRNRKKRPGNR